MLLDKWLMGSLRDEAGDDEASGDDPQDVIVDDDSEGGDPKPKDEPKPGPDLKALQDELAALRKRADESDRNAQFWAEQAKKAKPKDEPKPKVQDADDDDDPDSFLDELGRSGRKAVLKALEPELKRIREELTGQFSGQLKSTMQQVEMQARLVQEFPDLAKQDSDLFKETSNAFSEMVKEDPSMEDNPNALRWAAKIAQSRVDTKAASNGRRDRSSVVGEPGSPSGSAVTGDKQIRIPGRAMQLAARFGITDQKEAAKIYKENRR